MLVEKTNFYVHIKTRLQGYLSIQKACFKLLAINLSILCQLTSLEQKDNCH